MKSNGKPERDEKRSVVVEEVQAVGVHGEWCQANMRPPGESADEKRLSSARTEQIVLMMLWCRHGCLNRARDIRASSSLLGGDESRELCTHLNITTLGHLVMPGTSVSHYTDHLRA